MLIGRQHISTAVRHWFTLPVTIPLRQVSNGGTYTQQLWLSKSFWIDIVSTSPCTRVV